MLNNYRELALRTNAGEIHPDAASSLAVIHAAISCTSSIGSTFLDPIKKNLFYGQFSQRFKTSSIELKEFFDLSADPEQWPNNPTKWVDLPDTTVKAYFESKDVSVDMLHGILGIGTEAAEIVELLLDPKLHRDKVIDEVGDLLWYINLVLNDLDVSLEEVQRKNIEKLSARFPEKFDADLAINRD